jgi:hypothetical protein
MFELLNHEVGTIPAAEYFAGALDLKVIFGEFGRFVIVETV